MRTGSFSAFIALVPSLLMLCMRIQGGKGAGILFGEIDIRASEDKSTVQIIVQVEGENTGNFTAVVKPMTVAQFRTQRDKYGPICDSVMASFEGIDTAEEVDFSASPVNETMLADDIRQGIHEFTVNIAIINDDIQEPAEYFLVILDVQDSDPELLQVDSSKQCTGVKITEDKDDFGVMFEPIVTEMSEGAGEVKLFKIVKLGQTEQVVKVMLWLPGTDAFTVSETTVILQPNEMSATVNISVMDDSYPEDNETFIITGYTAQTYGRYRNLQLSVAFTINDNDYAMIGFNATEVTVIEGEVVRLTTVLKNNLTSRDYRRIELFTVKMQGGNATEHHYNSANNLHYFPGDAIEIQTVNDNKLEKSRQFEVILEDPSFNPMNILNPNRVIVTIRDNDGIPNQPSLGTMTFYEKSVTILWTVESDELRPIDGYNIVIESIQVKSPSSSDRKPRSTTTSRVNRQTSQESRIKMHQITVTNVNCKSNASGIDYCEHTVEVDVMSGTAYNIKLCAGNEFESVCDESGFAIPVIVTSTTITPAGLEGDTSNNDLPTTTKLWIVIGVLVALLLGCSIVVCLSLCSAVVALMRRRKDTNEEDSKRSSSYRMKSTSSDSSTEVI